MSRHSIALPATTPSANAIVVIGYDCGVRGPHYFCYIYDGAEATPYPIWHSWFTPGYHHVQQVARFEPVLAQWNIDLPSFIVKALEEDWVKNHLETEYCWQADGTFEQVR